MKYSWIILGLFTLSALTACNTTSPKTQPPSLGGVTTAIRTAGDLNKQAQVIAKEIYAKGTPAKSIPSAQLVGLHDQITEAHAIALAQVDEKQAQINDLTAQKDALQGKADYWHGKQVKALKEIWVWRGLVIVALIWVFRKPLLSLLGIAFTAAKRLVGISV